MTKHTMNVNVHCGKSSRSRRLSYEYEPTYYNKLSFYYSSKVLSMFPASSVQVGSLLLTQLQSAVSTLKAAGVVIRRQTEESMETVQDLIKHLQERSREGTLRSDKDTYALLGDNPGNDVFLIQIFSSKCCFF